jgi:stearoyl-CoA 9-desaturase NADPH oxidoreductase
MSSVNARTLTRVESRAPLASASRVVRRRLLHSTLLEALAYPHGVDRYVELVRPLLVAREVRAQVTAVHRQTSRSVTLALRPNDSWRGLRAGQFVNVGVEIDGVHETRPYSPAGSQHAAAGTLELTVSTHPDGKVSRHLREHARAGMIVGLSQAQGEFVLPDRRPERILLISGGSGITPVMAMLRTLCDEGFAGEIGFLNYARSPALALYGGELEQLAARHPGLRVARGYTSAGGAALQGRFRREHLRSVISGHASAATFVCGPPALIESVRRIFEQDGLEAPAIETFTTPRPRFDLADADADAAEGTIRFAASAHQAPNSGLCLLEQAEDAGLAPEYGCRMGICNTCATTKLAGAVRNVVTGDVSTAADEQIRICTTVALGDVVLDL